MNGYWKKPKKIGKSLMLGPIQLNWYGGFRVYLTWPGETKTLWPWREFRNLSAND